MKAAPIFDALTALHMAVCADRDGVLKIPHPLWMKLMQAEIGLRQALKDAGLELPVEQEQAA
jgi:hypothetical protein